MAEITGSILHPDDNPGAPSKSMGPQWPPTPWDDELVPDGRAIGQVSGPELYSLFDRLAIPGFSHSAGRQANVERYIEFLTGTRDTAGASAVRQWLADHK
jgi:hypothetical protein